MALCAGQGYIWLAHRQPDTPGWAIAQRSNHLWETMLDTRQHRQQSCKHITLSSREDVEWQVAHFLWHACPACIQQASPVKTVNGALTGEWEHAAGVEH